MELAYKDMVEFIEGYVDAAIWTGTYTDQDGEMGEADAHISYSDFPREHPAAYAAMVVEAVKVLDILKIGAELEDYKAEREGDWTYVGHDALLSLQGHGTGLWDRGIAVGKSLDNRIAGMYASTLSVEVKDGEVTGAYYEGN